jgi:hypothetical protein
MKEIMKISYRFTAGNLSSVIFLKERALMKTKIFFYLAVCLLVSLTSCYDWDDEKDEYYVSFEVDGQSWDLNEDNGTFDSYTSWLFDDIWECDWISNDNTLSFGLSCEPAPDSDNAEDGYDCEVYVYDETADMHYHSISGFSMTAVYSDKDYDYKGTFSGPGERAHGESTAPVVFSKGKFVLEYNSL